MGSLIYLYAILVISTACLAWIALNSAGSLLSRLSAITLAVTLMAVGYVGLLELLGRPRPIELQWSFDRLDDTTVLAADLREGRAIYLWLRAADDAEPLSYRLPWTLERAKQLQEAMRQGEASGANVRMRRPVGDLAQEGESLFYAAPQPELPPKQ